MSARSVLTPTAAGLLGLALAVTLLSALGLADWNPAAAQTTGTPTASATTPSGTASPTGTAQQTTTATAPTVAGTGTGLAEANEPNTGVFVLIAGGALIMIVGLTLIGTSRNPKR